MKGFVNLAADVPFICGQQTTRRRRRKDGWREREEAAEKQHEQKSDQGGEDDKSASHHRRYGVRRGRSAELRGGGCRWDHEVRMAI